MKHTHWMYNVFLILTSATVIQVATLAVEEVADNLATKRGFKRDGYTTKLVRGQLQLNRGERVSSGHYIRRRDLTGSIEPLSLQLEKGEGDQFVLELEPTPSVIHPNAKITFTQGDFVQAWPARNQDCFYTGHLKDQPFQVASFSFCHTMMGIFNDGKKGYWVEALNTTAQDDSSQEHILIASKDLTKINDDVFFSNRDSVNCGNNKTCDSLHEKMRRSTSKRSPRSAPDRSPHSASDKKPMSANIRVPRNTQDTYTIEMAVVIDHLYYAKLAANGYTTEAEVQQVMTIKLNGVQAEWGRTDQLGCIIKISVKQLVVWTTQPGWYEPEFDLGNLLNDLTLFFQIFDMYQNFDHVHVFTGLASTSVSGVAVQNRICSPPDHVAISTYTGDTEFIITAHEIGHQFNMVHDISTCTPADSIMGTMKFGWSDCSITSFEATMGTSRVSCLSSTEISNAEIPLVEGWPGMVYTNDEICALKAGAGNEYREYPYDAWPFCTVHTCINMDQTSPAYQKMTKFLVPIAGSYCGDGMVCSQWASGTFYDCITHSETGLDASLFNVVTGGWSEWGAQSSCSRTCGTGVQYRQRECNNPKPLLSTGCPGSRYDATLCNTQECTAGENDDAAALISQRASETCAYLKTNNIYALLGEDPDDYANTGSRFSSNKHGQCEVSCDTVGGHSVPVNQRFGLMPDGTSCTVDALNIFVENNNLPRASGKTGLCLRGYCEAFNCANTNADNSIDGCGVCQGDGSTCTVTDAVFSTAVTTGQRVTMVTIPAESFLIQAWFEYTNMNDFYIELYDVNDTPIIATQIAGDSAITIGTKAFANTDWNFHYTKQYLYATGPTNDDVVLKLFNFGSNTNLGVSYAYSQPQASGTTTSTSTSSTTSSTSTTSGTTSTTSTTASSTSTGTSPTTSTTTTAPTTTSSVSSTSSTTSTSTTTVSTTSTTASTSTTPSANQTQIPDNGAGHLGQSVSSLIVFLACLCVVARRL